MGIKNESELRFIQEFKSICDVFPDGEIQAIDPPGPDFLVINDENFFGIEVTEYIRGQSEKGSYRHHEKIQQLLEDQSKKLFESLYDIPLQVSIRWPPRIDLTKLTPQERQAHIERIVHDVECNIPEKPNGYVNRIFSDYSLGITRVANISQWKRQDGWIEGFPEEIQRIINSKNRKFNQYYEYCQKLGDFSLWLLIVAAGDFISSQVSFDDLRSVKYSSNYDKIFFYDRLNKSEISLDII